MPTDHDLIIRWSDRKSSLRRLTRTVSVPIHGFPNYLRLPGGIVAVVSRNNEIRLVFKAIDIIGPQRVELANGKSWPNGYVIKGGRRTLRLFEKSVKAPVRGWYAIGAFRYFNAAKMRAILVGEKFGSSDSYIDGSNKQTFGIAFRSYVQGIPGLPRNHPEAKLVDQYVSWMGEETRFGHNYIRVARLFVDLFDLTHWQLIEAKIATNRETIRMAIGQLRDYRRYYQRRHPSLAVLLAARPSGSCVRLLNDNRIAAIWRTSRGRFHIRRWQERNE